MPQSTINIIMGILSILVPIAVAIITSRALAKKNNADAAERISVAAGTIVDSAADQVKAFKDELDDLRSLKKEVIELRKKVTEQDEKLRALECENVSLKDQVNSKDYRIKELEKTTLLQGSRITELEAELAQLRKGNTGPLRGAAQGA